MFGKNASLTTGLLIGSLLVANIPMSARASLTCTLTNCTSGVIDTGWNPTDLSTAPNGATTITIPDFNPLSVHIPGYNVQLTGIILTVSSKMYGTGTIKNLATNPATVKAGEDSLFTFTSGLGVIDDALNALGPFSLGLNPTANMGGKAGFTIAAGATVAYAPATGGSPTTPAFNNGVINPTDFSDFISTLGSTIVFTVATVTEQNQSGVGGGGNSNLSFLLNTFAGATMSVEYDFVQQVPEPATLALLGLASVSLGALRRRRAI